MNVVDDDASLRDALARLFRSIDLLAHCYASVADFLRRPPSDAPSCLVIDVRLPGMSGLDFQARLSAFGIAMPVILMTGYGDIPMSVRAMKAGAVDFLTKPFRDQDMVDAVTVALEQDRLRRRAAEDLKALRSRFSALSPREQEVMRLVATGLMNKQVAGELGLSEITVKIHRGAAMRKMQARSLAELVRMTESLSRSGLVRGE